MSTIAPPISYEFDDPHFDVRELFCGECGYGVVVRRDPPECPMCRAKAWGDRPSTARWN
jgi:hypothetical protein